MDGSHTCPVRALASPKRKLLSLDQVHLDGLDSLREEEACKPKAPPGLGERSQRKPLKKSSPDKP